MLTGLRDGEEMPLICPTCQFAFEASMPAACYFAWGCFRYFGSAASAAQRPLANPLAEDHPEAGLIEAALAPPAL
jgi:hypothetical protein